MNLRITSLIMVVVLAASGSAAGDRTIVVEKGDTLFALARRHYENVARWKDIARANGLDAPYEISPGQILRIPDSSAPVTESEPKTKIVSPPVTTSEASKTFDPRVTDAPLEPAELEEEVEPTAAPLLVEPAISFDELVAIARRDNREILAARAFTTAANARIRPAGSLEDPTLGVGYQEGSGFDDFPSIGEDEFSNIFISLEQMFPGPGKRALRQEIAEQMWRNAEAEAEAVVLRIESEVKREYWELYRIDRERAILERTRDNLRALSAAARSRYSSGQANQEDPIRAGLEISMASERLRMLEEERISTVASLNALLARAATTEIGRVAELGVHLAPTGDELRAEARRSSPTFAALERIIRRDEAAVKLAKAETRPDWGVMGTMMPRGSLEPMWSVGLKIALPIRQGDRQQEWLREAEANLTAARHQLEGHWNELDAKIASASARSSAARDLVLLYDDAILPQAALALRSSIVSYESGRADFMTVIANLVALKQYEIERARRLAEFHQAVAEIESIVARRLTPGAPDALGENKEFRTEEVKSK